MSNQLLLYKQITALNRDTHRQLRLRQAEDARFAASTHLVPLAGVEFFQAARHYPILFVGEGAEASPIALLGLKPGQNGFVGESGQWRRAAYVPAFVRRYPFVLAQADQGSDPQGRGNFTVCFDREFAGWNEQEGQAMFDAEGGNSAYLDEMIRFLHNFTAEMERTRQFVAKLAEFDLLAPRSMRLTHSGGESFVLSDFVAVDEEKFLKLPDKKVLALNKAGYLGWVYAHLMSLGNANELFERHVLDRQAGEAKAH
ncbi:SapC family protein [Pseudoxanthomonas sp. 10H]|uniref:SapC family protein n=1 Tax=Pseudoxanthomonas sp. 10H TaxID=3242729 RepID=UPI003555FEFE